MRWKDPPTFHNQQPQWLALCKTKENFLTFSQENNSNAWWSRPALVARLWAKNSGGGPSQKDKREEKGVTLRRKAQSQHMKKGMTGSKPWEKPKEKF